MGIFSKKNKEPEITNAFQVNEVNNSPSFLPWVWGFNRHDKPLGNFLLESILNQIWQAASNITFKGSGKSLMVVNDITTFIDRNSTLLINQWIQWGYMVVFYDRKRNYRIPSYEELKFDSNGRIINKFAVVIYSPQYQTNRSSLIKIALPVIGSINKMAGSDDYLTETLGCLSILSGQDLPSNPAQKENFLKNFGNTYGIGEDKYQFLMSNREIKVTPINPPIKELGFNEKIEKSYKWLANLFGVPLQLLFSDSSTFNNVKEAKLYFMNNTIRFYAEQILKVGRELLTASNEFIPQNEITYKFQNTPELEKSLSAACEERSAYLKYLMDLKAAGIDVSKELNELYQESRSLFKEV